MTANIEIGELQVVVRLSLPEATSASDVGLELLLDLLDFATLIIVCDTDPPLKHKISLPPARVYSQAGGIKATFDRSTAMLTVTLPCEDATESLEIPETKTASGRQWASEAVACGEVVHQQEEVEGLEPYDLVVQTMFDHSCRPNCEVQGTCVTALRSIQPGQEFTIAFMFLPPSPRERRRELLRGRFGFECRCDWCDNYTQDGLPEELAELCEGFRCTNRGACMGHVTLLPRPGATEAGEDGLVECEACGTLQEVAELRAELSGYENDLKEALCPPAVEMERMRYMKLARLETLLTTLRGRLTTPCHWIGLMTLQALVVLCGDLREQAKQERYELQLAMSLQEVYGVCPTRATAFWAQHRLPAGALAAGGGWPERCCGAP